MSLDRNNTCRGAAMDFTSRQTFDIRRTWVGNEIVHHSDVIGASPVGAATDTSPFST